MCTPQICPKTDQPAFVNTKTMRDVSAGAHWKTTGPSSKHIVHMPQPSILLLSIPVSFVPAYGPGILGPHQNILFTCPNPPSCFLRFRLVRSCLLSRHPTPNHTQTDTNTLQQEEITTQPSMRCSIRKNRNVSSTLSSIIGGWLPGGGSAASGGSQYRSNQSSPV